MLGQEKCERAKVARLTDKQRACMQLVVMRKSSKEIARELGIAKPTVDQRISSARQILGARDRNEAALIFARVSNEYDRIIYDPPCVFDNETCADIPGQEARQDLGYRLQEPAMTYGKFEEHRPFVQSGFLGSHAGEIGTPQRILIIVGMTVGILSIILIGLSVAQSLSGMLTAT